MVVVFALEKFHSCLICSKVIFYNDNSALKYLFTKANAKPRLIRQVLLLQEFDLEIQDRNGSENLMADHLSLLEQGERGDNAIVSITEEFPDEKLLTFQTCDAPWYANFVNYLASVIVPSDLSCQQKKKFLSDVKYYLWEDLFLYKYRSDQIIQQCVMEEEMRSTLQHCHSREVGGHFGATKTAAKVLQSGFYQPTFFKDAYAFVAACDQC